MKYEKMGLAAIFMSAAILTGCNVSDLKDSKENGSSNTIAPKKISIKYTDGKLLGVSCGDFISSSENKGINICDENGNIVGFLHSDATVTNFGGKVVGECSPNFDLSLLDSKDTAVSGDCTLPKADTDTKKDTTDTDTKKDTTDTDTKKDTKDTDTTDYGNTDIEDGEETVTQAEHPDAPEPTCSYTQPNILPPCTGADGEVPL